MDIHKNVVERESMLDSYGYSNENGNKKKTQLKVGDTIRIKVIGLGKKGDFFGKQDGLVVFIKAKEAKIPVETLVTVKITEVRDTCAFSVLV